MSQSSILTPDRRIVTLPPTILTIPSPRGIDSALQLKIYISPSLSIPFPPFSEGTRSFKGIEECADVVVAIGGKILMTIRTESDQLQAPISEIGRIVEGALRRNVNALGITHIQERPGAILGEPQDAILQHRETLGLQLSVHASNPSVHSRLNHLILTGQAVSYLEKLDVKLVWAPTKQFLGKKRQTLQSQDEDGDHDEEDELVDDTLDEEDEDEIYLDDQEDAEEDQCRLTSSGVPPDDEGGPEGDRGMPRWMETQLKEGLGRLLRAHMVKRFPLIFDPGLQNYTNRLTLPYSLTSSLFDFFTLSSSYSPDLQERLTAALQQVAKTQLAIIRDQARRIIGLPECKKLRKEARKRRRMDLEEQARGTGNDQDEAHQVQGTLQSQGRASVDPDYQEARLKAFMRGVKISRNPPNEAPTRRRDEMGMRKLIVESVGLIGKHKWAEGRRGRGKLSATRINLDLCLSEYMQELHLGDTGEASLPNPEIEIRDPYTWEDEFAPDDEFEDALPEDDMEIFIDDEEIDEEDSQLPNLLGPVTTFDRDQNAQSETAWQWEDDNSVLDDEEDLDEDLPKTPDMSIRFDQRNLPIQGLFVSFPADRGGVVIDTPADSSPGLLLDFWEEENDKLIEDDMEALDAEWEMMKAENMCNDVDIQSPEDDPMIWEEYYRYEDRITSSP